MFNDETMSAEQSDVGDSHSTRFAVAHNSIPSRTPVLSESFTTLIEDMDNLLFDLSEADIHRIMYGDII